ncbi:helix-turn-helix domain-containing protein [Leptospira yasudae]|uniref:AraC family transcriptional regulator n=1 Tax=Leptospira yasudae TaxID=2202201 RepID=A0A6N4R2D9_9LEPT|nr:AraC family transcriptional regulator [Leptospira yasudae]TGL76348.1 AraC family transcriptional regulator [Leptospira yasudae]TGL83271.1 AraC family transcriptional regulator [Leptospira yasudae]TGL83813.1 AraC family transcriptional regulator [Leptospira yasudae]
MHQFLVWKEFSVYSGPSFSTTRHSHFFVQLCIANEGEFRLRGKNGKWRSYRAALVPSGVSHETEKSNHDFTIVLLDPLAFQTEILSQRNSTGGEPAIDVSDRFSAKDIQFILSIFGNVSKDSRKKFTDFFESKFSIRERDSELPTGNPRTTTFNGESNIDSPSAKGSNSVWFAQKEPNIPIDPRILECMEILSSASDSTESMKKDISLIELASRVKLSAGRFRHLFREETNITFSGYKLWLKTRRAILSLAKNPELIAAAYEGGFSDQAHFSRIFRRSFGMSPSDFAKNQDRFRVRFFLS